MELAFGVIVALTILALTTLFGLAFFVGGILIGTISFVGYILFGALGAALFCAAGAAMVYSAVRTPKPRSARSEDEQRK